MEIIIAIVALAVIVYVGYRVLNKENDNGGHPLDAATRAPYKVEPSPTQSVISNVLDVNGDGKVNLEDAKEVVKKTAKKAKEVTDEVVEKVKKPRGRKPKAK
jgi:hypothetical protein